MEKETFVDKVIIWAKQNPFIGSIILFLTVLAFIVGLSSDIDRLFQSKSQKCEKITAQLEDVLKSLEKAPDGQLTIFNVHSIQILFNQASKLNNKFINLECTNTNLLTDRLINLSLSNIDLYIGRCNMLNDSAEIEECYNICIELCDVTIDFLKEDSISNVDNINLIDTVKIKLK